MSRIQQSAQRRPGREPRRHSKSITPSIVNGCAQRRPGREPRRHVLVECEVDLCVRRSTKAGA